MKIAYLVNRYPAISHSFIRREILALERLGHDVLRMSIRGDAEEQLSPEDQSEMKRTRLVLSSGTMALIIAFLRVLSASPARMVRALRLTWTLGRRAERPFPIHLIYLLEACLVLLWVRRAGAEHLHAHFGTNSAEVAMLVHELGGPTWSFTAHGPEEFDKARFIALPEKIRRSNFAVAISSFGRSQLFRLVAHDQWHKIKIVRCGLEPSFHSQAPISAVPSAPRLVCVGRLCEQKGQLLLVEAARRLADLGTAFELVLAGDGEMRGELEQLIATYKLQSCVKITGWITGNEVREQILSSRALVLPSFAEGLPVVIMEAMALRRPVISTFVAGTPELVVPGEHGWLVPAGDVEELAAAMRACLDAQPETIDAMGAKARERVLQLHDIDREAAELAKLFQSARDT